MPSTFKIDGNSVTDPVIIAEKFCQYFSGIGPTLAKKIPPVNYSFTSFLTHGYSVGVFVSYCHQPQNRRFLLFSSSLLCAPGAGRTGRTGLECFVIGCFHNAWKHRAFG